MSAENQLRGLLRRPLLGILRWLFPDKFKVKPTGVRLCEFDGVKIKLDFSQKTHVRWYERGSFEPGLTYVLNRFAGPGDIYVDIGANIGWHALHLLVKHPALRKVYAFEPVDEARAFLEDGLKANGVRDRCQVYDVALSDNPGVGEIKKFPDMGTASSSLFPLGDLPYETQQIRLDTLDNLAGSFEAAPTIIKCDVEGSELRVLSGAADVMRGKFGPPPAWFLEVNYETSAMAGYFPWKMIEVASQHAPYTAFLVRNGHIIPLADPKAMRHGSTLLLAVPEVHQARIDQVNNTASTP